MNCESVGELADLYLYGELESGQEEELEQHAHGCAACRSAIERRRALHRSLDTFEAPPTGAAGRMPPEPVSEPGRRTPAVVVDELRRFPPVGSNGPGRVRIFRIAG